MSDMTTAVIWTASDSLQASEQGWGILHCGGEYQLQRDDDSEIFLTDVAASTYVKGRAALGDELAQKALSKLASCGSDDVALFSLA